MKTALFLGLLAVPAALFAHIEGITDYDSKTGRLSWVRPSIPPALHRPAFPARILDGGIGRSGVHFDRVHTLGSGAPQNYPYDSNGQLTAFGAHTRWGLPPGGVELAAGLDWPFFVPYGLLRIQPLGRDLPYGPFVTLELGATGLPDFHGGLAVGAAFGPLIDLSAAAHWGYVLDRTYQEYGAILTLHASTAFDVSVGLSHRSYLSGPPNGEVARGSLNLEYGNSPDPLDGDDEGKEPLDGVGALELLNQQKYRSAAKAFRREIDLEPRNGRLWWGYGQALKGLEMDKEAKKALERARKLGYDGTEKEPEPKSELPEKPLGPEDLP